MTAKEKAAELYDVFNSITPLDARLTDTVEDANRKCLADIKLTKQCALICLDEIIKVLSLDNVDSTEKIWNYWREVEQEINKL